MGVEGRREGRGEKGGGGKGGEKGGGGSNEMERREQSGRNEGEMR